MEKSGQKLIVTQTTLPDIFVIRYAGVLSSDALYTYLWINVFYRDKNFDMKNLYDSAILSKQALDKALAELVANDLVIREGNSCRQTDIIAREVEEFISHEKAYAESLEAITGDVEQYKMLAESISNTFFQGKMSTTFYALIDKCLFEYKFESTVVYSMFQEGLDREIVKNIYKMRALALSWYEKGFTTSAALADRKEYEQQVKDVISMLGALSRQKFDGIDLDRIESWVRDLHCSKELIEYAYRANKFRSRILMSHVGDTLTAWTSAGITTVAEAARYEEEKSKENKRKYSRKKGRYNGSITGAEAGITVETKPASTTEKEDKPAFSDDDEGSYLDDILDIFGGNGDE